jgi:trk system potassium uptake protein
MLMLPISTISGQINFVDALFTSTSAVCVTGLVVFDTGTHFTMFGQIIILVLIQIGGLGFMTSATIIFILLGKKIGLRNRLVAQESLSQLTFSGVIRLIKYIAIVTVIIELAGAVFLSLRFIPQMGVTYGIYYSVFHSISAFCNAGFDLIGGFSSFTGYTSDLLVSLTLIILIVLGGLSFSVFADIYEKSHWKKLALHTKLILTLTPILIILGTLVFFILERNNPTTLGNLSSEGKIIASLFQSVTPRTAGFSTIPTDQLRTSSKFFTIILMFIGASPASTAGGIKITTFGVLVASVVSIIQGKEDAELFHRRIPQITIYRAVAVATVSIVLIVIVTMALTVTENVQTDFMGLFFEVVSAFGTVGLSTGITPSLTPIGRLFIIFTMLAGRIGALSLIAAIAQRQRKASFHYPEEKVMIA